MAYLVDTPILTRLADSASVHHHAAAHAIVELHRRGETLHITAQNLVEFRSVATRPLAVNGLGLSAAEAEAKAAGFETMFPMLEESAAIYPAWKSLVAALGIISKQVHDARLVAVCHVHNVSHLLTFNIADFKRFAAFGPGLVVVDPATV